MSEAIPAETDAQSLISAPDTPIIELKNVEVTFKARTGSLFRPNHVHAVQGVDMKIMPGKVLGIVGESGCGKSTTANVMCGLQVATKGQVFFMGKDVTKRSAAHRRHIGSVVSVVFQDPATALNPRMTVQDQLADPLRVHKIGTEETRDKRVRELLGLVGLPLSALNALPGQLSGGQRQRVAIARALITKPAIVLADEPTGNLDSKTSAEVLGLIKRTSAEFRQTVVMITHNNDIARLADRIVRIEDGKIVE